MNHGLLEAGLIALRTRGFAGEADGDIKLISLRRLTREQLERVLSAVEEIGTRVGVPAEVSGIGYGCTTVNVKVRTSPDHEKSREQIKLLFKAFTEATELTDCDIQIIIERASGQREDLRERLSETEDRAMDLLSLGKAISAAVSIVKNLPGAIETAKEVHFDLTRDDFTSLGLSGTSDDGDPLSILVDGLSDEVRQLSSDFVKNSTSWSVPERQEHQKRVASKASELLVVAKPILKLKMRDYPVLVDFFNGVLSQDKPAR